MIQTNLKDRVWKKKFKTPTSRNKTPEIFMYVYLQRNYQQSLKKKKKVSLYAQHHFKSALLMFQKTGFCCVCLATHTKEGSSNKAQAWPCLSRAVGSHTGRAAARLLWGKWSSAVALFWLSELGGCRFHLLMLSR